MKILVTGGAGFIGSAVIRHLIRDTGHDVVNLDCLTYAASLEALEDIPDSPRYRFERVDIGDAPAVREVFARHGPDAVMHLAAESHVDRSIDSPRDFVTTNVVGTCVLLEAALEHYEALSAPARERFRFHHISTDEVFGSLGTEGRFVESTPYAPRSPYSASKAGSDHLVRAWHHTYGLPTIITNCSNNYGPYQFPEKLIPLTLLNAVDGRPLPVYGNGENIRDWLHVEDHAQALLTALEHGRVGRDYNIGGDSERRNIDVVRAICAQLDELLPRERPHAEAITFVTDRPGHDQRYAIDAGRAREELGWRPQHSFESGLRATVQWYLENLEWCRSIQQRHADAAHRRGLRESAA